MSETTSPTPLYDSAILRVFGESPEEVRQRLTHELNKLEEHLALRQADWTQVQPGRDWSPAQEIQHVISIGNAGGRAAKLLLSDREIRPFPQVAGTLKGGKRQAPEFSLPSAEGLAWDGWQAAWAEHRQQLEGVAAHLRATPGRTLWHPYFGEMDALDWLRSLVGHVRGHRKLLEQSAAA